jgi:hypothetical protein
MSWHSFLARNISRVTTDIVRGKERETERGLERGIVRVRGGERET